MADGTSLPSAEGHTVTARHEDAVWSVCWTRQDQILTGSVDETAKVWSDDLELQKTLPGHRLGVVSVAASSTDPLAVTSSIDNVLRLWDLEVGSLYTEIKAGPGEVWTVAWSPTDAVIASGSQHGGINVWNIRNASQPALTVLDTNNRARFLHSVAFNPDGTKIACGGSDGEVHVFDVATGQLLVALQGHTKPVRSLAFTSNGYALVTASDDQRINVYEMPRHALVSSYDGHASWILGVATSPDGRHFASCGVDKRIKIWDLAMKDCVHTVERHTDAVWSLAFSPNDGNLLASGAEDGVVMVSNLAQHVS